MPKKFRFLSLFKVLALLALVAAAVVAVVHFSRPEAKIAVVTSGRAINAVPGSVTVFAEYEMQLKSEIGGRVLRSLLDPGLRFKAGDFLVQLDTGDLELEIERNESEYNAHKSRVAVGSSIKLELATAREELQNKQRLLKSGNMSEAEVTRQERLVRQYEQRVELEDVENQLKTEGYENSLKVKKRQREKMTMLAPFDGVVSTINARTGDLIGNNAPIATLISTSRTVEAKISEENFAGISIGQKASVRFLGYGAQLYGASVIKILPTADPETQRYMVHLNVDLTPEMLVPGLTGEVSIVIGEREAAAIVPRRALRGNELLVVKNGVVETRTVKLGYVGLNQAEVLENLESGEQVIIEEHDRFLPGDRVRAVDPSASK
jgi:RND family efflux transporter MFP subunit